ncbi:MAG: dephospho-CoA kinase [Proteobacteria bacterium]|nr:dephospho-CoA kinase [Pseudomonadota bacterium]MDA0976774.1 dephospho-CoA kinase [Pseudomonadota bacterium]MDA1037973.1 dephospho-CoA kinase [Pseudomonadota bacterium]
MIVGLTGGIGSGKSAAAKFFVELGVDLIDADNLAKNVLNKNSKGYELFINEFGEQYLDNNNNIDRDLLRKTIFNDSDKKNKLENIIHPQVRSGIEEFIKTSKSDYCIVVVPLIYETKSFSYYDRILVIDCDEEMQTKRSAIRDNTENKEIKKIISKQASREERLSIADDVILNNRTLEFLKEEVIKLHKKYIKILSHG